MNRLTYGILANLPVVSRKVGEDDRAVEIVKLCRAGRSRADFAEAIGLPPYGDYSTKIRRWETGSSEPNFSHTMAMLAERSYLTGAALEIWRGAPTAALIEQAEAAERKARETLDRLERRDRSQPGKQTGRRRQA